MTLEPGENISTTNIDTLVSSLYQCVETRGIVFWLLSQPLPHLRFNLFVISEKFSTKSEPLYATNTSQYKQEIFMNILCIEFLLTKNAQQNTALR
jgi:hypothetical protein